MSERPPTSHDVARLAGVSQSAVSRAFTPGASVSPQMRERIERAAAELGYRPNLLPRMMLSGRTGIVAVVVGGLYNPFYTMTLEAFTRTLRDSGRQVMLVQVESDRALDEIVGEVACYRVDAVVSALSVLSQEVGTALSSHRIPIVTLNSAITTPWLWTVRSDNEAAGAQAARLLHSRGGRHFAYVGGPEDSIAQTERAAGFRRGLASLGIHDLALERGDYHYRGGYDAGMNLLKRRPRPDAIFCANDLTAMGVIDAFRIVAGLYCPGDVRVVGYDNIEAASWPPYMLTTFDQRVEQMVAEAVAMLDSPPGHEVSRVVEARLEERRSTAAG